MHTYEYSPSVQEVETLSALQLGECKTSLPYAVQMEVGLELNAAHAGTSTFGFLSLLGCGFGTMAVAYRIPRLR